MSQINNLAYHV